MDFKTCSMQKQKVPTKFYTRHFESGIDLYWATQFTKQEKKSMGSHLARHPVPMLIRTRTSSPNPCPGIRILAEEFWTIFRCLLISGIIPKRKVSIKTFICEFSKQEVEGWCLKNSQAKKKCNDVSRETFYKIMTASIPNSKISLGSTIEMDTS